jgi:mono/diheme cytochrome c family protein
MRVLVAVFTCVFGLMLAGAAAAQDGSAVFQANCATCHAAADAGCLNVLLVFGVE